jgi:hypothetical protein
VIAVAAQASPILVNGVVTIETGDGGYGIYLAADDPNQLSVSMSEGNSTVGATSSACISGPTAGGTITVNGITEGNLYGPDFNMGVCLSGDSFAWSGTVWTMEGLYIDVLGYVESDQTTVFGPFDTFRVVTLSSVDPPPPTPEPASVIGVIIILALMGIKHIRRSVGKNLIAGR